VIHSSDTYCAVLQRIAEFAQQLALVIELGIVLVKIGPQSIKVIKDRI